MFIEWSTNLSSSYICSSKTASNFAKRCLETSRFVNGKNEFQSFLLQIVDRFNTRSYKILLVVFAAGNTVI